MDRVYESGAVAGAPAVPAAPSTGYPTEGNPGGGVPATKPGPYWFYMMNESLRNLITNAGLTPDHEDLTLISQAVQAVANSAGTPTGAELLWPKNTVPTGWFEEDGSLISMTDYESLYDEIGTDYGVDAGVASAFDNTTDIITLAAHGLADDDVIEFSNSGGALPTGLSAKTKYFVISSTTNTFQVSLTKAGAAVNFTTDGTGTNYFHVDFSLPDARGEFVRIWDHGAGNDPDAAGRTDRGDGTTGDNVGTKQADDFESHTHTGAQRSVVASPAGGGGNYDVSSVTTTGATGGNETRPRSTYRMMIIKY